MTTIITNSRWNGDVLHFIFNSDGLTLTLGLVENGQGDGIDADLPMVRADKMFDWLKGALLNPDSTDTWNATSSDGREIRIVIDRRVIISAEMCDLSSGAYGVTVVLERDELSRVLELMQTNQLGG